MKLIFSILLFASTALAQVEVNSLWLTDNNSVEVSQVTTAEIDLNKLPVKLKLRAKTSSKPALLQFTIIAGGVTNSTATQNQAINYRPLEGAATLKAVAWSIKNNRIVKGKVYQIKTRFVRAQPSPTVTTAPTPSATFTATPTATATNTPTATPTVTPTPTMASSGIIAWANDGGDKITQDEQRSSNKPIVNSVWNGSEINLFGAKNEVVNFNLVLEAPQGAEAVTVDFDEISATNGAKISSRPASGSDVLNYVGRNIECFYVRYLQIKGLSKLSYESYYDERHVPARFRRPFEPVYGQGSGTWNDRPDHDKYYPEIAVPKELVGAFNIDAGKNQSVWCDIFIPKSTNPGIYTGNVQIRENGSVTKQVPVKLEVKGFTLPDQPSAKTMLFLGETDIQKRHLGKAWLDNESEQALSNPIQDRYFQMAHRHKVQVINGNVGIGTWTQDRPRDFWLPRLSGQLFTPANGYEGPGEGVGNGVFSIGTYGSWNWKAEGESGMRSHSDGWVNWFDQNSPNTDYFLYLIDESTDYNQINTWASWINNNTGPGRRLMSFATAPFPNAAANAPDLDIAATWMIVGITNLWQAAIDGHYARPDKGFYLYNGHRPVSGSFATEDDGISLRQLPWAQFKKNIKRWFFWNGTYWNNYQGGAGETNVFRSAFTFGSKAPGTNSLYGETGWNYSNGDGVMMYPGTDVVYPSDSYGINGPIASLRLKHWRRGIQDVDYLTLAKAKDANATNAIVNRMIPRVLWEVGVTDPNDPSWVRSDISWTTNPDAWEQARKELAAIIER